MTKQEQTFTEQVLTELGRDGYVPRRTKELSRDLNIPKGDYRAFRNHLKELAAEGAILRRKGGRWALPEAGKRVLGRIHIIRSGSGYLLPEDAKLDDLFIPEHCLGSALHGDRVAVAVDKPAGRGLRHYARVVEVLERGSPRIVALITEEGKARPEDPKNPFDYDLESGGKDAPAGQKVLLEITTWPGEGGEPSGRVLEVLGPAGEPDTETAAILANYDAPGPFSEEVKAEVRNLARSPGEKELARRLDVSGTTTLTIDPKDARDFDDALSYETREDGTIVVGVHIADVSYFVKPGSRLDEEARERSTSIYLPGRVIPMLPEELSTDLCSLRPDEVHLTKTVLLRYAADGKRLGYHIHRSYIRSAKRFTYEEAYALLTEPEAAEAFEDKEILATLTGLHALAQVLREERLRNGSIELNMPEFRIAMDADGHAKDIVEVTHDSSHQLVEEFMLAANVALAEWSEKNGLPVLYRTHASPSEESVAELAEFLTAAGYPFKPPFDRRRLNHTLEKVRGKPEEHAVNLAVLKSFMQAVYAPDPSIGHFALNFPDYMHFTSPIRRYPDLHLHQMLDAAFSETADKLPKKLRKLPARKGKAMEKLGVHTSGRERRAMKIEEAVKDFRRLELLSRREQRIFRAVVTGVRRFGIFVEIEEYFVEGMIPRWMLEKKGFSTREDRPGDKRRSRARKPGFHLGQEVEVRINKIDLPARICEMEFLGTL